MNWTSDQLNLILEIAAVFLGIVYVLLIAKNKISGWVFGGLGSLISIWLFIRTQLLAEAILYVYYVFAAAQGYLNWHKQEDTLEVYQRSWKFHGLVVLIGIALSFGLYFLLQSIFPSAARPLIDSFTTMFSFIATYLTVKKYIGNWIYWIIIDAATVYLYISRDLYIYAGLMVAYTLFAVFGYRQWKKLKITNV